MWNPRQFLLFLTLAVLASAPARGTGAAKFEVYHDSVEIEKAVGYAAAVRDGDTLHVAGTLGAGKTLEEQLQTAYRRIEKTLAHFGLTFADVVNERIYTTDFDALIAAEPARKAFYAGHTPAATWVQVSRLYIKEAQVEIELVATLKRYR
jgi:enamine deaminase RidA (YjgF/YER057c/UK114 family)